MPANERTGTTITNKAVRKNRFITNLLHTGPMHQARTRKCPKEDRLFPTIGFQVCDRSAHICR